MTGWQRSPWEQVDAAVVRSMRKERKGVTFTKDLVKVMVLPGNSGEIRVFGSWLMKLSSALELTRKDWEM